MSAKPTEARMAESKRAMRGRLAALPLAAKLELLDTLRERELAIRAAGADIRSRKSRPRDPRHSRP